MKSYTDLRNLFGTMTNNLAPENLTLGDELLNDSIRRICSDRDWDFLQKSATANLVAGQQFYTLPYDYNTLIDTFVTIGTTTYIPKECPTREYWDILNQQTTFQSNFPEWFFIFNGQLGLYPTPSTSITNGLTFVYRRSVVDLNAADYLTGTVAGATNGSTTITGTGTTWTSPMTGRFLRITASNTAASSGDNAWYEIASVTNSTTLVLKKPYAGATIGPTAGAAYLIGQMPPLPEPYHDLPVYEAAEVYYTALNPDVSRAELLEKRKNELFTKLSQDHGTKTLDPAIHDTGMDYPANPNLFISY